MKPEKLQTELPWEQLGAWRALLADELEQPYLHTLAERTAQAYARTEVYPPREELFSAFALTPPARTSLSAPIFSAARSVCFVSASTTAF